ncbi:MAG: hypothetical protein JWP97_5991 [Labilithrix sp.]|nr:hypothetical protein [Labilithrix sp.]
MTLGLGLARLSDLDEAWSVARHGAQLRAVQRIGGALRERFAAGPRVVAVRTLPLAGLAYPTRYAFAGAALAPAPFVVLTHRCVLVQFLRDGELTHLLFNPSEPQGRAGAPFFSRLREVIGHRATAFVAGKHDPLETQLARHGLTAADIDLLAFDSFQGQDLRGLLGTEDGAHPARFPAARLLAPKSEWDDWDDLHPLQSAWFVKDGKRAVNKGNVVLTSGDYSLGDGVMLLRTPGRTSGHQTLFLNTGSGVWGVSANGVCADSWSPVESRIKGLPLLCKRQDVDVVPNANTPEYGALQYTSMVLERIIADRVKRAPAFVQMFPSSEVTPSLLAPGIAPTVLHRAVTSGEIAAGRVERASA